MLKYRIVQDIVYRLGFSVAELLPLLLLPGQTAHGKRDESLAGPCCGWAAGVFSIAGILQGGKIIYNAGLLR